MLLKTEDQKTTFPWTMKDMSGMYDRDSPAAKELFFRLDPILRLLLASLESYNEIDQSANSSEERILGFLRTQTKLMSVLQNALTTATSPSTAISNRSNVAAGLVAVADYILLPLVLILERSPKPVSENCGATSLSVRRSEEQKSVETAAQTLSFFLQCIRPITHVEIQNNPNNSIQAENEMPLLPSKLVVRCLVACTTALPMELQKRRNSDALDKGEACTEAIFSCTQQLVVHHANSPLAEELVEEIGNALNGALVARIAHCCTTILTAHLTTTENSDGSHKTTNSELPDVRLCTQALKTLGSFMDHVPVVKAWRALFPGCFAGIYRFILSQLRLTTHKLTADAVGTMTKLLLLTLSEPQGGAVEGRSEDYDVLGQIQALAQKASTSKDMPTMQKALPDEKDEDGFKEEINNRLPAPLSVVVNLLSSGKSFKVRLSATTLCSAILLHTRSIWTIENWEHIEVTSMECCLSLLHDSNQDVVSSAKSVLKGYKQKIGLAQWSEHISTTIAPRIVDVMNSLPALCMSRKESELRSRLQLIDGYLFLAVDDGDNSKANAIAASLASSSVSSSIQKNLRVLFDVDFDSIQFSPRIKSASLISKTSIIPRDSFRFRHMTDETAIVAKTMVHTLSKVLCHKHTALFVDSIISDLLHARTEIKNEQLHIDWLHGWVGSALVANEMLFGLSNKETSLDEKKRKKQRRILKALASSVIPVVTSGPLWNLPTTSNQLVHPIQGDEIVYSRQVVLKSGEYSVDLMKGNAVMVCSLLGLIGTLAQLLQKETCVLLSVLLHPLFERASYNNHSQVQGTAIGVLGNVASACGVSSVSDLVNNNFDYLFGTMLDQLRNGSGQYFGDDVGPYLSSYPSVVEVVLQNAIAGANPEEKLTELSIQEHIKTAFLIDLVHAIIAEFDRNISQLSKTSLDMTSLGMVRMFDAVIRYLLSCHGKTVFQLGSTALDFSPKETTNIPWLSLLDPFRCDFPEGDTKNEEFSGSPENGFVDFRKSNNVQEEQREDELRESTVSSDEVNVVNLAVERICFLLSTGNLMVQVASCEALVHGYSFFDVIRKISEGKETHQNTFLLQSISSSWPAIISRFRSASSTILQARKATTLSFQHLVAKPSIATIDTSASQETFLCQLLGVVSAFCELSDDFMVNRFKSDVWPIMAKIIGVFIADRRAPPPYKEMTSSNGQLTLLKSTLESLTRVFVRSKCGPGLADIIPAAGTLIFPLLADSNDAIANAATDAVKAMLMTDCDSLWRALVSMSGMPFPDQPIKASEQAGSVNAVKYPSSQLQRKVQHLIEFVNQLPEQPLY